MAGEYYTGTVIFTAGNWTPPGFLLCDGSFQSIVDYPSLYSIINTYYGGDGRVSFQLPNLLGRAGIGQGTNPATQTSYQLGEFGGLEGGSLIEEHLPPHSHLVSEENLKATSNTSAQDATIDSDPIANASFTPGGQNSPGNNVYGATLSGGNFAGTKDAAMKNGFIEVTTTLDALDIFVNTTVEGTIQLSDAGDSQPIQTMPPFLALRPMIYMESPAYPPRT